MATRDYSQTEADYRKMAADLRKKLMVRVEMLSLTTSIEDIERLLDTIRNTLWFEIDASQFDHDIELKNNRITLSDNRD